MPQFYVRSSPSSSPPSEVSGGTGIWTQGDEMGSLSIRNEELFWSEQGKYFKACNATMGTGIAMGIQTSFSDTANVLFVMVNSSTTKKVIPHYIRLVNTAAGATTTSSHLAVILDTANRYSSGGTDLTTTIVNSCTSVGNTSVVTPLRYNCTATAASAKRQIGRAALKTQATPCWVVGDEVKILFNSSDGDQGLISGAAATRYIVNFGPCVLEGQNHSLLLHMWNPANATTAPSWEFELAWWEK